MNSSYDYNISIQSSVLLGKDYINSNEPIRLKLSELVAESTKDYRLIAIDKATNEVKHEVDLDDFTTVDISEGELEPGKYILFVQEKLKTEDSFLDPSATGFEDTKKHAEYLTVQEFSLMENILETNLHKTHKELAQPKVVRLSKIENVTVDDKLVLYFAIKEAQQRLSIDNFTVEQNCDILPYDDIIKKLDEMMSLNCMSELRIKDLKTYIENDIRDVEEIDKEKENLKSQVDYQYEDYRTRLNDPNNKDISSRIPYFDEIKSRINNYWNGEKCLLKKLNCPMLIELIWSYWIEEGMLVQVMNAIELRFQNKKIPYVKNQLQNLDISPLYPLNGLLWEYIESKTSRLSIQRRTYEYLHQYGIYLFGKAVPKPESVDSRSRFLESFHGLLHLCTVYYKEDADLTYNANAFPLLNALRDLHLLMAEGAYNQYNGLAWKSRKEMMFQQYILSRPEMREFLGSRVMSPVDNWVKNVDTVKKLMGKPDISMKYFSDLAETGENIILSIRFGNWNNNSTNENDVKIWLAFWKNEIQRYIYSYKVVTGVDLGLEKVDYAQPGSHIKRRMGA